MGSTSGAEKEKDNPDYLLEPNAKFIRRKLPLDALVQQHAEENHLTLSASS
ncbi:hypothetical protein CISIN_1g042481mg [Citrus sinensis]|uniref:Uncharacterized protein n=1 Tax=Citrus sinensis TaxID=2711 RepID=A0A067CZB1_CITSI|nr:hypothetical protein CISIN_1g042481mg [Citrus sinensis]